MKRISYHVKYHDAGELEDRKENVSLKLTLHFESIYILWKQR